MNPAKCIGASSTDDPFDAFPASLDGDLCWDTRTFGQSNEGYIVQLTALDIDAVERAVASFKGMSRDRSSCAEI